MDAGIIRLTSQNLIFIAIISFLMTLYKYSVKGKGIIMADLLVQNYNSGNFKYNIPVSTTNGVNVNATAEPKNKLLEKQPQTDTVILSDKKTLSKQNKILLALGGIATTVLGAVLAVKGYRSHQITKGIEKIEQKFLKIQENMPEVQKTFKEVFLRDDITEKEALEMLNRYKEVEKISVTGSKKEYIRAVYEEAKRNFVFANAKFELQFGNGQVSSNGKTMGGAAECCKYIMIDPSLKIEEIMNTVHHEMRHMKQNYYAVNYDPQRYKSSLARDLDIDITSKDLEEVLDDSLGEIQKCFNLKTFSRTNIPNEQINFAKQCLEGCETYVDAHKNSKAYFENFKEIDAYHTGELIDKLFYHTV